MNPRLTDLPVCPQCGRPIPPGSADGLCRRCLCLALGDPNRSEAAEESIELGSRQLPDYELVEELARGGMGIVFKARQRSLNRWVAVKVVSGGVFASPDFVKRFRTEAEAAAALEHPHIVPIYEIGEVDGQPFFSMKLLEGGTFGQTPVSMGPPPPRAIETMVKIAQAVHYAHQRGVLHRDIKPNNILLDGQGEPYLTDFGLAKLIERDSTLTRTLAILGTPAYMSPEQARGEARSLTTSTDVYGLGAVLYQQLTGLPPFAGGTTIDTVRLVLETEPRHPSSLNPAIDRDLETICLKCLEKDPDRRYGSAEAVAHDLERWLRHEPILARPATKTEKFVKWVRRRPAIATLWGVALIAFLTVFVISALFTVRLRQARLDVARQAETNRLTTVRLLVSEATRATDEGDYYRALLPLSEALHQEAGRPEREGVQRRRLGALLRQSPRLERLWVHQGPVTHASLSPDQRRLAVATGDGVAQVWDLERGDQVGQSLVHTTRVAQVVLSPDNRLAATLSNFGQVQLWDIESGQPLGALMPHRMRYNERILFAPGGDQLFVPGPQALDIWQVGHEPVRVQSLTEAGEVHGLDLSQSGTLLVTGGADGHARIWDVKSGCQLGPALEHPAPVQHAFFSSGDQNVVTIARDWVMRVWETRSGRLVRATDPNKADIMSWAASADGRWLATGGFDNLARVWDATREGPPLAVLPHQGAIDAIQFSEDGHSLVSASFDGTARRWDREGGRALPPIFRHSAGVSVALPTTGNQRLITAGFGGDARLWRLVSNNGARALLQLPDQPVLAIFGAAGDGVLVATASGQLRRWSPNHATLTPWSVEHGCPINSAAANADRTWMVLGGVDGCVSVWKIGDTKPHRRLPSPAHWNPWVPLNPDPVTWTVLNADASQLAVAGVDGTVYLWDIAGEPRPPIELKNHSSVAAMAFSASARFLATSDMDGHVRVWDATTGQMTREFTAQIGAGASVQFSPDERQVLTAHWDYSNDGLAARLWDPATGTELTPPLLHRDGVLTARFSPNGRYAASGGEDNLARVWFTDSGKPATPFLVHRGFVTSVGFSRDNHFVATAARDGTARIWNVDDGQPVTPPLVHGGPVTSIDFDAQANALLTASDDRTIRLWDISPLPWDAADVMRLAELLSSHHLEPTRDQSPLTASEMKRHWEILRSKHPDYWLD